jgi:hypothetical protein
VATKPNNTIESLVLLDATFNFRAEVAHETLDGPCSGITESADRSTFNLFSVKCKKKTRRGEWSSELVS